MFAQLRHTMPESAVNIVYVESVLGDPEGLHKFQHRNSLIYASIPGDSLADEHLPDFVASLSTTDGPALSQLIAESGLSQGTCFYKGWIDQAVFTISHQLVGTAADICLLLPRLISHPTEQNGDTVIGFVPDDTSFISLIFVSRETRFVYMSRYLESTAVHTDLTIER
jgi:hypothetical protein